MNNIKLRKIQKYKFIIIIVLILAIIVVSLVLIVVKPLITTPKWLVGDWFEVEISCRNLVPSPRSANNGWDTFRKRYTIVGKTFIYGNECYELSNTYMIRKYFNIVKQKEVENKYIINDINYNYYFRTKDLSLIAMKYDGKLLCGTVPWTYLVDPEIILCRFPIMYNSYYKISVLLDMNNHPIYPPDYVQDDYNKLIHQSANYQNNKNNFNMRNVIIKNNKYTYKWSVNQIWWSQAWNYIPNFGTTFRASLYSTSQDGILNIPLPKIDVNNNVIE